MVHGVLAGVLGAEDLYKIMQPLLFDHSGTALRTYFKSHSLCCFAMINNQISLKTTLLGNGIHGFIETITKNLLGIATK